MPLFRRSSPTGPAEPWPWWRRHKIISGMVVAVLLAGALVAWRPWQSCGTGMTPAAEAPEICVGLNLGSGPFRDDDELADLEKKVADHNAAARANAKPGSEFRTIVHVNDMTVGDSASLQNVRHGIQGALTAASMAQEPVVLLLANYGPGADSHGEALKQIVRARESQRIVAVTGLGQSLENTRSLAKGLSDADIAVVGAVTSGDDMNQVPNANPADPNRFIEKFFRITPNNTDAARAAVSYLAGNEQYQKVMRLQDETSGDGYVTTLGEAFGQAYAEESDSVAEYKLPFYSTTDTTNRLDRSTNMSTRFKHTRGEICKYDPDLIYFAGRGVDMAPFIDNLTEVDCPGFLPAALLTSDDATSIINKKLEFHDKKDLHVFYTGMGTGGQWNFSAADQKSNTAYQDFEDRFLNGPDGRGGYGTPGDLVDGYAMSNYDAVKLAAEAARDTRGLNRNLKEVAGTIKQNATCGSPFEGATGKIAFRPETHGNPINKAMPIMEIGVDGSVGQVGLVWADGVPFDEENCKSSSSGQG